VGALSAERLFEEYFLPGYPEEARADLARARATDANPGNNPSIVATLEEAADLFAKLAPAELGDPGLVLDRTDASVHRLAARLTRERRDAWLRPSRMGGPPMILNLAIHGGLYLAACVVRSHGGVWQARNPLWESLVRLESAAGTADLPMFHWWLKALSDDEIDAPRLVDRYRTHVEVPTFDAGALRPIAPADRRIPRLGEGHWLGLVRHLKAYLPELRELGPDFPPRERFDELAFRWLGFELVGDGRMLLVHGPSAKGVHLFWLDRAGFVKAAFYATDPAPEHRVELAGDKLRVTVSVDGRAVVHEMLWWGA
jgi:hypothetical protein